MFWNSAGICSQHYFLWIKEEEIEIFMEKMKRACKFIPILLVLAALVFGLIIPSISAKAASVGVASVDGAIYSSLQEAVDAAGSNSTIELVDDVVLTKTVNIPSGKNITIKDNGSVNKYC